MEHIHDVPALLSRIRAAAGTFICTYCGDGDAQARRAAGYFNDFSRSDIERLLDAGGWSVETVEDHGAHTLLVCR